jgi:hypothetical protein
MSNSNNDSHEEKDIPDLKSLTLKELRELKKAAAAGSLQAQKRLTEIEGLESYKEYKQLQKDIADKALELLKPVIDPSIFDGLVAENSELLRQATVDSAVFKGIADTNSELLKQATTSFKPEINDSLINGLVATNSDSMNEILDRFRSLGDSEIFRMNDRVSGALLSAYVPSPEEQLRNEIAENNFLVAENNRLQRELIDQNRKLQGRTTKPRKAKKRTHNKKLQLKSIRGMIDLIAYRESMRRKGRVIPQWTFNPFGDFGRIDIATADKIATHYGDDIKACWDTKEYDPKPFVEKMLKDYPGLQEYWESKAKEDF